MKEEVFPLEVQKVLDSEAQCIYIVKDMSWIQAESEYLVKVSQPLHSSA
jgi:hypothetical protein